MMLCFRTELHVGRTMFKVSTVFPANESLIPAGRPAVIMPRCPVLIKKKKKKKDGQSGKIKVYLQNMKAISVIFTWQTLQSTVSKHLVCVGSVNSF